jgi:hypothetical protein
MFVIAGALGMLVDLGYDDPIVQNVDDSLPDDVVETKLSDKFRSENPLYDEQLNSQTPRCLGLNTLIIGYRPKAFAGSELGDVRTTLCVTMFKKRLVF